MKKLNLPPFEYKIKRESTHTRIFDIIRKKYLVLTPEEWVRQHFIHFLIGQFNYPKALIKVETGIKYNELSKRSDIVAYDRSGVPFLLVECKSHDSKISKSALFQAVTYNKTLHAKYLVVTNGMTFICGRVDKENKNITWLDSLPPFPG